MTYCLAIKTHCGIVFASDSRTNAGLDQVNTCRKMHTFVQPGERAFILLTSGGLSLSQSVLTGLGADFRAVKSVHTLRISKMPVIAISAHENLHAKFNDCCVIGGATANLVPT